MKACLGAGFWLLTVGIAACGGGLEPLEGYWQGDRLLFQVRDSAVIEIGTRNISCNGEDGCFAELNRFFPEVAVPIDSLEFSTTLEHVSGTVELTGEFTSSTYALGTYSFESADGCCSVSGEWRAEFFEPFPDRGEEAREQDATAEEDGTRNEGDSSGNEEKQYPPDATPEQIAAWEIVAGIRDVLGLPRLIETDPINKAAQAHATYFKLHCNEYLKSNLSPHSENPDWALGYTGTDFYLRMLNFGFKGNPGWEVMAFYANPSAAIDGWMETLYHRIPFVHPNAFEMGYGAEPGGCYDWSSGTDVMDFSTTPQAGKDGAIAWPYDGQINVNPSWMGYESPQPPMPKNNGYPSGPIITLTFPSGSSWSVSEHRLIYENSGEDVPHQYVDPKTDPAGFLQDTVSLYSLDPLNANREYRVRISGKWKNKDTVWEWTFKTGNETNPW